MEITAKADITLRTKQSPAQFIVIAGLKVRFGRTLSERTPLKATPTKLNVRVF